MRFYLLTILVLSILFNCKNDGNNAADNYAYLGGKIINPNSDFVILSKSDIVIDSIKLDKNNQFVYRLNNLESGLYTFYHGGEIQMVFLEPKDSVVFRLNTLEFDESLVFTGEGDKKNNYFINEFLENEIQEQKIFKLCQLKPHKYESRLDSLRNSKLKKLEDFKSKFETTPLFDKIAKANIDYSYYSSKEVYPFVHHGNNKKDIFKSLPSDFYNFRKTINYNDDFHKDHHHYSSFLRFSINNLALKNHLSHTDDTEVFKLMSLCYNMDRLKVTDSLVKNTTIKNNLLQYFAVNYLSKNRDTDNNTVILNYFLSKSTDEESENLLKRYVTSLNNLKEGSTFPITKVVDYHNNEINLNSLITTPTVICFWSKRYYNHFKESHYKLNDLKIKYPEVKFIVINIDDYGLEKPKKALKENKFKFNDEYQFKNPKESVESLGIQPMTKTIVIDKHQKIVYNNANIFSINFEEQLLGAINRK